MALGNEPYRHIYPADVVALRDVSPLAERVYMHLAFGERSRACCLVACDPEWLRLAVRTRSVPEVVAALAELADAGWLVLDQRAKQAWLPRQASRTAHDKDSQLIGWRKEIDLFRDSEAKTQAIAFIESKVNPRPTPVKGPSPSSSSISSSISSSKTTATDVAVFGSRTDGATQPSAAAPAQTQQTTLGLSQAVSDDPVSDDHAPTQSPKRQPRGQDGPKPAKSRSLAQQPPTLDETRAIFAQHEAPASEAQKCLDYWISAGFRRKAGPVKDWPATCRTWINNWRDSGQTYGNRKAQTPMMVFDQANLERQMAEQERQMREAEARGESWF
jgi:hypothetical protein